MCCRSRTECGLIWLPSGGWMSALALLFIYRRASSVIKNIKPFEKNKRWKKSCFSFFYCSPPPPPRMYLKQRNTSDTPHTHKTAHTTPDRERGREYHDDDDDDDDDALPRNTTQKIKQPNQSRGFLTTTSTTTTPGRQRERERGREKRLSLSFRVCTDEGDEKRFGQIIRFTRRDQS